LTTVLLLATGCADSRDDRLAELAQQSLREQSAQNKRLAEQSQQIAEASRRLVEGDAAARKDLLDAKKQLSSELHTVRAGIDRQREEMEQERRNIARQRGHDPIIVQTINALGLTLACLAPLALAGYIIHALNRSMDESDALCELLVMEMAVDQPRLLSISHRPAAALEHAARPDDDETAGAAATNAD
jgi:hypothetical protein